MTDYFRHETKRGDWYPKGYRPTAMQVYLWEKMKTTVLNPIREHIGVPLRLSNGVRTEKDYKRLLRAGYYPSITSDHFAQNVVSLKTLAKDHPKRLLYGDYYKFSTFACDVSGHFNPTELARDMYLTIEDKVGKGKSFIKGLEDVRQLIVEAQTLKGKIISWLHISLPVELIYSTEMSEIISDMTYKTKYLKMNEGNYEKTKFL